MIQKYKLRSKEYSKMSWFLAKNKTINGSVVSIFVAEGNLV